jgi:hypothetical protein
MQIEELIKKADDVKAKVLEMGIPEEDFNEMVEFLQEAMKQSITP